MASRQLNITLDLDTGSYSGRLAAAGGQMRKFGGDVSSSSAKVKELGGSFDRMHSHMQTPLQRLRDYVLVFGNLKFAMMNIRDMSVGWIAGLVMQSAGVQKLTTLMIGLSQATTEVGKATEARQNLAALFEMARKNGYAVEQLQDAFIKLKSAGIDPLNGSLQSLTDAVANFGGNTETMHRASIAIQQMSGKGVISMEELRQQLGEAVPTAMRDMADAAGMSMQDFTKAVSLGKVQAGPALTLMFREFQLMYQGAGARMAETMNGQLAQFKTNVTQLSTYFTGLANGGSESTDKFIAMQKKALDEGQISLEEYNKSVQSLGDMKPGQGGGIFASVTQGLKELNAAMRSNEGKKFVADLGQGINTIVGYLVSGIRFVVTYRDTIVSFAKGIALTFAVVKSVRMVEWFAELGSAGLKSLRGIEGSIDPTSKKLMDMGKSLRGTAEAYTRLENIRAIHSARIGNDINQAARNIASLTREGAAIRQRIVDVTANIAALTRQRAAQLAQLETGKLMQAAAIAEGRSTSAATRVVDEAQRALTQTNKGLIRSRGELRTAAIAAAATEAAMAVQTRIVTIATAEAQIATVGLTFAQRAAAVAATAGAAAMSFFGAAVNFALGPIGQLIILLGAAAWAAGLLESQADKTAAAVARLAQGIADKDALELAIRQKKSNDATISEYEGNVAKYGPNFRFLSQNKTDRGRREYQKAKDSNAALDPVIARGQNSIDMERGDRQSADVNDQRTNYLRKNGRLAGVKANPNSSKQDIDAAREHDIAMTGAWDKSMAGSVASMIAQRRAAGQNTTTLEAMQAGLAGASDANGIMSDSTDHLRDSLFGAGKAGKKHKEALTDAEKAAKKAATETENAQQKYDNMIANQAGTIADMNDQLKDGNGNLASFQAKLSAGLFPSITIKQTEKIAANMAEIDKLEESLAAKKTMDGLGKTLSKVTAESTGLWESIHNGTWDAVQRTVQLRAQFEGMMTGIKDPVELERIGKKIDEVVAKIEKSDAAQTVHDWEEAAKEIEISLLSEDEQRQANFDREVARQQRLVDLTILGTVDRARAELALENLKKALAKKAQRESEGAIIKMARDWANLGHNIDNALAAGLENFVDSLIEGKANFADFAKSMIKDLAKIIIKAMIAYAILSALGIGTGAGGKKESMGSFMKGQVKVGLGGYQPAAPAPVHHTGGWIGSNPLKAGDVPIIGQKKEAVLTQSQQDFYGKAFDAAVAGGGSNNVSINVINNSGTAVNAEKGQPYFNGREMIIDVVLEAMHKQGPMRDGIRSIK